MFTKQLNQKEKKDRHVGPQPNRPQKPQHLLAVLQLPIQMGQQSKLDYLTELRILTSTSGQVSNLF